ncbi:hypothetical protein [Endozoicomonas sp. GU-1]|uniref:hypothetical protein n=1 Tax=Endozoicomonas sp. GU-1 TaxID=3009078 RepID=UPI0022B32969|nr:hypothetical protein [Endozoicomonas sp. GU-1]WBA83613.1 hypothetical protein O2T12_11055 [Endozoicomonas sp. GU-1]WBA86591.1 hypothetical protein O3276_00620 [Endozoicomonas sp. GU-1]
MTGKVCAITGISGVMAIVGSLAGALTLGSLGYTCATQEQRSLYFSKDGCRLAKALYHPKGPFSERHSSRAEDQEQTAPDDSPVIVVEPLLHENRLPASPDSMAPPPYPPIYENLNHAPPAYDDAINPVRDVA